MQVDMNDVQFISETTLTIRGTRRRTTVPKYVVEKLKVNNGDRIRWVMFNDQNIVLTKVSNGHK